jgi:hypothetical protein
MDAKPAEEAMIALVRGCDNNAVWEIWDVYPDGEQLDTYSCQEHLSDMISVHTDVINRISPGSHRCCFVAILPEEKSPCEKLRSALERVLRIFQGDWPKVHVTIPTEDGHGFVWLPIGGDGERDAVIHARKLLEERVG